MGDTVQAKLIFGALRGVGTHLDGFIKIETVEFYLFNDDWFDLVPYKQGG